MTEQQATYTANPPTEPKYYKAIGSGVFAFYDFYGEDVSVLIIECHAYKPHWRGFTYAQACEKAEKIAAMLKQSIAY